MHSPLHPSASDAQFFSSTPATDHLEPPNGIYTSTGHQRNSESVSGWPWCHSCRPYVQILLGQAAASIAGPGIPSAPWAFPSPFPEYVCVPALVHRSQLALFAPSAMSPASPSLSPQEPTRSSPINMATAAAQRKTRGVKIACTNCRMANKRCDEGRPCARCIKNGLEHSCVSAERKPRRRRTVRQTATATMTVSATQVSVESPTTPKDEPFPTTIHIAGGASYVDDTQEITDVASHSSPSGSSVTAGDFDNPPDGPASAPTYAVHDSFWASLQPLSVANATDQFSSWGYNDQGHATLFAHAVSPTAVGDHRGLCPTGLEGSGAYRSPGQRF